MSSPGAPLVLREPGPHRAVVVATEGPTGAQEEEVDPAVAAAVVEAPAAAPEGKAREAAVTLGRLMPYNSNRNVL